jgi:hypothetical protein
MLIASGANFLKPSNIVEAVLGPDGFAAGDGGGCVGLGFAAGFAGVGPAFGLGFVDVGAGFAVLPLGNFGAPALPVFVAEVGLDGLDGRALGGAALRGAAGAAASMYASSKSKNPISIAQHPFVKRTTCGGHYDGDENVRLCVAVRSDRNAHFAQLRSFFCETYDVFS